MGQWYQILFKVSKNSIWPPYWNLHDRCWWHCNRQWLVTTEILCAETAVPSHLVLDSTIREVTVEVNQTTNYTARNNWVKVRYIRKIDPDSGKQVAGATYAIYNDKGQELEKTRDNCHRLCRIRIFEIRSVRAWGHRSIRIYLKQDLLPCYERSLATNKKITVTGEDERQTGRLELTKKTASPAYLLRVKLLLKVLSMISAQKENILDPADQSVKYAKGALVATLTTDANAKASISNLYLGNIPSGKTPVPVTHWILPMISPSPLRRTKRWSRNEKQQTVKERVKAQAFSIIKMSDNGAGEADKLAGVEFTIKAQKDIDKYGSWKSASCEKRKGTECCPSDRQE